MSEFPTYYVFLLLRNEYFFILPNDSFNVSPITTNEHAVKQLNMTQDWCISATIRRLQKQFIAEFIADVGET